MADKKGQAIIIKKVYPAHHGGHGGAWKVAFADFMTAMMAFFLVMWLMGTDEETKAAVAEYFNNPSSAWRLDMTSKETMPLGERSGAGENMMNGNEGQTPSDMIDRPARKSVPIPERGQDRGEIMHDLISNEKFAFEEIRFTIPEDLIFEQGSAENFKISAKAVLIKLGALARKYNGEIKIKGSFNPENTEPTRAGSYEFQLARAVAIEKWLVEGRHSPEDRIKTQVAESGRLPASGGGRRIEFTLSPGAAAE